MIAYQTAYLKTYYKEDFIAATMTTAHPDYAQLAARISVSNLHKNTKKSFSETMKDLYEYVISKIKKNIID